MASSTLTPAVVSVGIYGETERMGNCQWNALVIPPVGYFIGLWGGGKELRLCFIEEDENRN